MGDLSDTICALSTPPGRSGIAVVRVSGDGSLSILRRVFKPKKPFNSAPPRHALYGSVIDPRDGSEIDEAITTFFAAPHSYTGEDLIEFSLHGNPVLISALLDSICFAGARLATPGEFTMRAFLRGRIDLTQAEAVRDIIEATTLYQAQVAARQRAGALAQQMQPMKKSLVDAIVELESAIEFVEEDLPIASRQSLSRQLNEIREKLRAWIDTFHSGRVIREGFTLAIIGRPNVGKSSLFNVLLQQDRSIVAETPGTTRDLVSETTSLAGVPVRVQDTAGIHNSEDAVEKLGIDRSIQALADADVTILVVDASRPLAKHDVELREQVDPLSAIIALNKSDLQPGWSEPHIKEFVKNKPHVKTSVKTLQGIEELRSIIMKQILGNAETNSEGVLVTNLRHCKAIEEAESALATSATALEGGLSEEFVLIDLHRALQALGSITGETNVENLLDEIFSRFCVGK